MSNIYEKFNKATASFTAQCLIWNGKPIGRIVIKYGNAATAYVQIWGAPMVTARATGYGYDKASAAVMAAIGKMREWPNERDIDAWTAFESLGICQREWDGGTRYTTALEHAGFTVGNVI